LGFVTEGARSVCAEPLGDGLCAWGVGGVGVGGWCWVSREENGPGRAGRLWLGGAHPDEWRFPSLVAGLPAGLSRRCTGLVSGSASGGGWIQWWGTVAACGGRLEACH